MSIEKPGAEGIVIAVPEMIGFAVKVSRGADMLKLYLCQRRFPCWQWTLGAAGEE
jgi:hypothetical protein